jgi:hypothetical protein
MALTDLWTTSPDQLREKHVQQVIAFAGSGKLRDGGDASSEFRDFLSVIPSATLSQYTDDCLRTAFEDSGLALQDIVNEIGRRLGFNVVHGVYRGTAGGIGFDGIWNSDDGKSIVIEVKTTDAYRIDLNKVAGYRRMLIQNETLRAEDSSILVIVGRQDTGDLEAQIRGSRHAWDTRLISTDALIGLLRLKEDLEEPVVVRKIRGILTPQEFTKVDGIIEIVFATTEDVRYGDEVSEELEQSEKPERTSKFIPAAFHEACMIRIESRLARSLVKRSRAIYATSDGALAVVCSVSRQHGTVPTPSYWFAFLPHQKDTLLQCRKGYVAFGCGSEQALLLIPVGDFIPWLEGMNATVRPERTYWHVSIFEEYGRFNLRRKRGYDPIDVTKYLLASGKVP